ncbi:MAG: hypothetical protein H0Z29_03870 [Candidatus Marinimicrobia bacterium]|nr:hypothetical protein [Candidatus Neomarinimicrobiota bacterium]
MFPQYMLPQYDYLYQDLRYYRLIYKKAYPLDFITKPFDISNIADFVKNIDNPRLNLADKYINNFYLQGKDDYLLVGINSQFNFNSIDNEFRCAIRTYGLLPINNNISVVNVMAIDPWVTKQEGYIGKQWRGLAGYTEQAYIMYKNNFMRFSFGRSYYSKGNGRTGNLTYSWFIRPLDNVQFELKRKNFTLSFMLAQLDPINGSRRYLSTHTIGFRIKNFSVDFTESILYGGSDRLFTFSLLNPFLFFHGEQMNDGSLGVIGNTLGNITFDYLGNKWALYGEVLIDDVQLDKKEPGDLEPNEVGFLVGMETADIFNISGLYIGIEYIVITNRTYKTPNKHEWFIHRNVPIGYPLGSDLDRINIFLRKYIGNKIQVTFNIDYIRRGEGELSKEWDQPWMERTVEEGYSEPFPTGIVEYNLNPEFGFLYLFSYSNYIKLNLGLKRIDNYKHEKDKEKKEFYIALQWLLDLKKPLLF